MKERIEHITLDTASLIMRNEEIAREKERIVKDILEHNSFSVKTHPSGPYHIHFTSAGNQLVIDIRKQGNGENVLTIPLMLGAFRRVIRDYHLICDSYVKAIESAHPAKIEAIDMGRRGVHNEGAEMLAEQLEPQLDIDFETARRLFTLISVLHMK